MEYGFVKVASAVPYLKVADCEFNKLQIELLMRDANRRGVEIVVFPELCVTGYTCQDLFFSTTLLTAAEDAVNYLLTVSKDLDVISIIGVPILYNGTLKNCAVIIHKGDIRGIVAKKFLPNYGEFYEKRWFTPANEDMDIGIFYAGQYVSVPACVKLYTTNSGVKFGIEICEDLWSPVPPSTEYALAGAQIIFNLSASDELIGKHDYLKSLVAQQSARLMAGYVYSSCGFGESTQDVVYGGNAMIYENGRLLAEGDRFHFGAQLVMQHIDIDMLNRERRVNTTFAECMLNTPKLYASNIDNDTSRKSPFIRKINPWPFVPETTDMQRSCEEIFSIQVAGLAKRLVHTDCKTVVIGVSGGLDSTLALLVCVKAFDKLNLPRKGIVGVTMPGFGTTNRTHNNAVSLMKSLGVTIRKISIKTAVKQHFKDIGHDINVQDVTYENSQARERTQILMDLSNQLGGLVIGTGDLSELALGWATYNGDHMSMYGVNVSIPKTLIKYLVHYVSNSGVDDKSKATLMDIIDTPISPELIPADEDGNIKQKTEDLVGPYELHDFFLYYFLRYGFAPNKIYFLAQKAFDGHDQRALKYDKETIKKWMTVFFRRFFSQQFKRSCLPDGPKVGSVSLSPRGDWRMPSDASADIWLKECEEL